MWSSIGILLESLKMADKSNWELNNPQQSNPKRILPGTRSGSTISDQTWMNPSRRNPWNESCVGISQHLLNKLLDRIPKNLRRESWGDIQERNAPYHLPPPPPFLLHHDGNPGRFLGQRIRTTECEMKRQKTEAERKKETDRERRWQRHWTGPTRPRNWTRKSPTDPPTHWCAITI